MNRGGNLGWNSAVWRHAIEVLTKYVEALRRCDEGRFRPAALCYNCNLARWRYRLGVRTEDSQSSNPGSIPGSATSYHPLKPAKSAGFVFAQNASCHPLA